MKLEAIEYFNGLHNMALIALREYVKHKAIRIPARELQSLWQIACDPRIPTMEYPEHPEYFGQHRRNLLNMLAEYPDETLDVLAYVRRKLMEWQSNPDNRQDIAALLFFSANVLVMKDGKLRPRKRLFNCEIAAKCFPGKGRMRRSVKTGKLIESAKGVDSVKKVRLYLYKNPPTLPKGLWE